MREKPWIQTFEVIAGGASKELADSVTGTQQIRGQLLPQGIIQSCYAQRCCLCGHRISPAEETRGDPPLHKDPDRCVRTGEWSCSDKVKRSLLLGAWYMQRAWRELRETDKGFYLLANSSDKQVIVTEEAVPGGIMPKVDGLTPACQRQLEECLGNTGQCRASMAAMSYSLHKLLVNGTQSHVGQVYEIQLYLGENLQHEHWVHRLRLRRGRKCDFVLDLTESQYGAHWPLIAPWKDWMKRFAVKPKITHHRRLGRCRELHYRGER
ncbi:hypothetical protein EJ04DRAFT_526613 [Polyplosphaeria fusca]|uniref:Uncharacterized protein n=1 Tax=Polyplosphaeria fusca TaxID=682080 RepID=A0A9P4QNQ8_9PLEO|nr:hypothetical protein EJ04DRAFT_526613 [Polyplosphaeria fusca]